MTLAALARYRTTAVVSALLGVGGGFLIGDEQSAPLPPPGPAACAALTGAALTAASPPGAPAPITTITNATYAPAGPLAGGRGSASDVVLPAHCIVRGAIASANGRGWQALRDAIRTAAADRLEWALPLPGWRRKRRHRRSRPSGATPAHSAVPALARGFAVVTTDAGHQGGGPEFGLDPLARIDHAYAAHERTATTAKALIARYYGRRPDKSYFVGCSGGGRQGMMFAQRYPDYFDGIVACAPAMSVSSGATIAAAWDTITLLRDRPCRTRRAPILSRAFSNARSRPGVEGHARGVRRRGRRGRRHGAARDACRFDPGVATVRGDKTRFVPVARTGRRALSRAFDGPNDSSGRRLYVGQPWDPGISAPGWRQWKLGTSTTGTPNAANTTLMAGALAYEFFTPPDPSFAITTFNFDRDPARMEAFSREYDTYRDATLAAFKARGGKLLIFHGTADGIFSASESVDYYQRLAANNGGVAATQSPGLGCFLIPGMNHCPVVRRPTATTGWPRSSVGSRKARLQIE